ISELIEHLRARRTLRHQLRELRYYFVPCEVMLDQLRHYFFTGDQIHHGEVRDLDSGLTQEISERRDPIDHYEGKLHEGSLHSGRSAGDYPSPRVGERRKAFRNQVNIQALKLLLHPRTIQR